MEIDKEQYEVLLDEQAQLHLDMLSLELGDDMLMTNANGNLPRYRTMQQRMREVSNLIYCYEQNNKEAVDG